MAGRPHRKVYEKITLDVDSDAEEDKEDEFEDYKIMLARLDQYFATKENDVLQRHKFWSMKLQED